MGARIREGSFEEHLTRRGTIFVILLVMVAIVTRFTGLDQKFFWGDETQTAIFTAGSTIEDVRLTIYDGRPHTRGEVMAHQFLRPDRTAAGTIRALAVDDPKNTPLYFVTARAWMMLGSPTISGLRSWSALLSIAALAAAFILTRELVEDSLAGWIAVGVLAVSPLHLVFAQEGRQYMCWVVFVLTSSWLLIGAVRRTREKDPRIVRWYALYAVALTLAWYSHLLTIFVVAAHATWVVIVGRFKTTGVIRRVAVAMMTAGFLFSPWALLVLRDTRDTPAWIPWRAPPIPWVEWLQRVVGGYSNAFMDVDSSWLLARDQKLAVIPLLIVLWAVVRMLRSQSRETRWFLVLLVLFCSLPFVAADLVTHGQRANVIRYQFPAVLALQIGVSVGLAAALRDPLRRRRFAGIVAVVLLAASGLVSISQYKSAGAAWWNKNAAEDVLPAAAIINRSPTPLVISSMPVEHIIELFPIIHPLADRSRILMAEPGGFPAVPDEQKEIFLWKVAPGLPREFIRRGWKVEGLGPANLFLAARGTASSEG